MRATGKTASKKRAPLTGPVYLDASALAKLYLPEAESDRLEKLLVGRDDLWVSHFSVTEVISAAARRSRDGELTPSHVARLHRALLREVKRGQSFEITDRGEPVACLVPPRAKAAHRFKSRAAFRASMPALRPPLSATLESDREDRF